MKIIHVCLSGDYTDGLSYQENLLSKYHAKTGHEVTLIASEWQRATSGGLEKARSCRYVNTDGVRVIRIPLKGKDRFTKKIRRYKGFYEILEDVSPDVIFHHGCQSVEVNAVIRYIKKHPDTTLYMDNHSDYSNSASNWLSKNIQHKMLWRHYAKKINPYVRKFYGVLPARVDFLVDLYHLPPEKVELLVMGADDELVEAAEAPEVKASIREKYGINEDDFLIITGGKIDGWKKQTLLLMDAVNQMEDRSVKLLVFGSVTPELREEVNRRCSERVQYIGWAKTEESYRYFAAADLAVFPGRHSVFWEQVAGQGIPMIVKYWEGTTDVDCNGNMIYLHHDSVEEIRNAVQQAKNDYPAMKKAALAAKPIFSYASIAERSIELPNTESQKQKECHSQ